MSEYHIDNISKYLNGSISAEEAKALFEWVDSSEENEKIFLEHKTIWSIGTINSPNKKETEKAWKSVKYKKGISTESKTRSIGLYISRLSAVAAILIGVTLGIHYFITYEPEISTQYLSHELTNRGEKSFIQLPDGTKVWLNADSKLHFNDFDSLKREVFLEGEAFFEVTKDSLRPFIVKTTDLDIKVLGTSFNVMSYPEDNLIQTTLVEGKVQIQGIDKGKSETNLVLKPNQKVTYLKKEKRIAIDAVDAALQTAWREGKLVVEDEDFGLLIKKVERWFDVDIVMDDYLQEKYRYTLTIRNESLDEILDIIKLTSPLEYKKNGDKIIITEKLKAK